MRKLGPLHNSSVWVGLASLLSVERSSAVGKRATIFAYGSGQCATMLVARVEQLPGMTDVFEAMAGRVHQPTATMLSLINAHRTLIGSGGSLELPLAKVRGALLPGSFYLAAITANGQRSYARLPGGPAAPTIPRPASCYEWPAVPGAAPAASSLHSVAPAAAAAGGGALAPAATPVAAASAGGAVNGGRSQSMPSDDDGGSSGSQQSDPKHVARGLPALPIGAAVADASDSWDALVDQAAGKKARQSFWRSGRLFGLCISPPAVRE